MSALQQLRDMFVAGGPVMWPLLLLSVVSVALSVERMMFWIANDRPSRGRWLSSVSDRLRTGDLAAVRAMTARDGSVYGRVVGTLIDRMPLPPGGADLLAVELVEAHRRAFERFSATMSTIITAAPMLGILGTVMGIIQSFQLLGAPIVPSPGAVASGAAATTDPTTVASGIAEALITTAFGLVVAMATLFPHAWFRAKSERCVGRIEGLVASAAQAK